MNEENVAGVRETRLLSRLHQCFRIAGPASLLLLLVCTAILAAEPRTQEPIVTSEVKGDLREVDGLRVMRVWGTPREQGFAQGYLLGAECIKLLDADLKNDGGPAARKGYEAMSSRMMRNMKIAERYREELEGMIEGIKARLNGNITVPTLGRSLEYRDLVAVNCIPETAQIGCSSFAAWGEMTADGATIAGRNLDWYNDGEPDDSQILVARVAGLEDGNLGWVSLTWPMYIGCLTGMNAEGVTVSMHDVLGVPPSETDNMTPRGLALREAIESAHAQSAAEDVATVLRGRRCMVANNVPVAMPYLGRGPASVVFEYDGDVETGQGVTMRGGKAGSAKPSFMQTCTNSYRKRASPTYCDRYDRIQKRLKQAASDGTKLDVAAAWDMLDRVATSGWLLTYQSVVFEPNKKLMHIKVAKGGRKATRNKAVTVDAGKLLSASPGDR